VGWQVVETHGAALVEVVKSVRGAVRVCMEEGTQSSWPYEILSPLVEEVAVVTITEKPSRNKNDTGDAFRPSEMHRTRSFKRTASKDAGIPNILMVRLVLGIPWAVSHRPGSPRTAVSLHAGRSMHHFKRFHQENRAKVSLPVT
jgi:hypothetical protein